MGPRGHQPGGVHRHDVESRSVLMVTRCLPVCVTSPPVTSLTSPSLDHSCLHATVLELDLLASTTAVRRRSSLRLSTIRRRLAAAVPPRSLCDRWPAAPPHRRTRVVVYTRCMSLSLLTRTAASLSRTRKPRANDDFVPFSYALFVLAVFHVSAQHTTREEQASDVAHLRWKHDHSPPPFSLVLFPSSSSACGRWV